jgi:serine/threonine protein kinase
MRERRGIVKSLKVDVTGDESEADQLISPSAFRTLAEGEVIEDYYEFEETIYTGSLRNLKDKVVAAKRAGDGCELAVKIRSKRASGAGERPWREIMTQLRKMGRNQHVLDIVEIVEDKEAYYIVMPKCNGGQLLTFLTEEAEVAESECQRMTREILLAVGHLHAHNIVHRDVKPENIMFDSDNSTTELQSGKTLKLLDYDTCVSWIPGSPKRRLFAGTPGYIAPESLLGDATPQSDLFSVGVILYILMTGVLPWSHIPDLEDGIVGSPGANRMYKGIRQEIIDWDMEPWPAFPQARDLCQQLLAFEPEHRPSSVGEALAHPWLALDVPLVVDP